MAYRQIFVACRHTKGCNSGIWDKLRLFVTELLDRSATWYATPKFKFEKMTNFAAG
jgi:hypothetical protein